MRTPIAALLIVCACGSGVHDPTTSASPETAPIVAGSGIRMSTANPPHVSTLAFPLERVWRALPAAYDSLALPLTVLDPNRYLIGNEGVKLFKKLGQVPLSKYMDCGHAQIGESADSYDVYLSVLTKVRPAESGGTELVTTTVAAARPMTFAQDYSRCSSTGAIERRLADLVKASMRR